ncbi:MAG: serine/threonine protein kinase [Deltaproteobacteria bacterium]|nr:MAG: serine/threonine protein kinase [Deltaproteobacteria bacterium]
MADETLDLLDTRATLRPSGGEETFGEQALTALRAMGDRSSGLVLGETLGKGGMGLVRVGEQRSVGRAVAIKTLKNSNHSDQAALELLREGWVTGHLEHPNIVPVYDVGTDASGQPFLVLKRIDGLVWTALIREPETVHERFGARSALEWHLDVLLEVCDAVRFAHDRGVVHRDLKPDNVMVGQFGEVYVLDWGIAASLEPDPTGRLPRKAGLCGSPAYMAPEMFELTAPSPSMDIYLLGGLLHEILYGEAPHRAHTLDEARALSSRPVRADHDTEPELAALCARALDPDPAKRPASATALARELRDVLEHRESQRLARRAAECASAAADTDDSVVRRRHFAEARFGWQQALERWPENADAQAGITAMVRDMARWELANGHVQAAAALLDEHPDLEANTANAIRDAVAKLAEERARLDALARDQDEVAGIRTRMFLAGVFAFAFIFFPLVMWTQQDWLLTQPPLLVTSTWTGVVLVMTVGLLYWARDSMGRSAVNRAFARLLFVVPLSQLAISLSSLWTGDTLLELLRHQFMMWAAVCAGAGAAVDARIAPSAIAYMVAWVMAGATPELGLPMMAAADLVLAVNLFWMWGPNLVRVVHQS